MRNKPPALFPLFRSQHQAALLTILLLHPDQEYTLSALAQQIGASTSTVMTEVNRLAEVGLLTTSTSGRNRLVRVDTAHRLARPITDLVLGTYGPLVVIGEEFGDVPAVDQVLIFGSWAARYAGERGSTPRDVDVLVIGAPDRQAVYDAADRAQERLGWPVNPTVVSSQRWADAADPLVRQVRSAPLLAAHPSGAAE
jgi:predicted nucleotidyltransferase